VLARSVQPAPSHTEQLMNGLLAFSNPAEQKCVPEGSGCDGGGGGIVAACSGEPGGGGAASHSSVNSSCWLGA